MIYCVHCGTQNRDGSKFCNNCGARFVQEAGLRCPMCSTPNQVESVFCSNCGARLVPLTAASMPEAKPAAPPIKGLSLPAKPFVPSESLKPAEPEPVVPETKEETPEWIARLREHPPSEEEPDASAAALTAEPEEETPEWLTRLRAATPADEETPRESEAEQIPDWLKKTPPEASAESFTPAAAEERLPDWFEPTRAEAAPAPPPGPIGQDEIPDWLKQARGESAPEPAPAASAAEETPEWLRQPADETPMPAAPIAPEPAVEEVKPAEGSVIESEEVKFEPSAEPAGAPSGDDEIPDWLREAVPVQPSAESAPKVEPPQPAELPAWVAALKPTEFAAARPPAPARESEPAQTATVLAGLTGVLPVALAVAEPHPLVEKPKLPSGTDGGQIFESILATPVETAAPAAKPARQILSARPFIYVLLLLAVLVPVWLPYDLTSSTFSIAGTPAAEMLDTLQKIPARSTVLVAFDYDPSMAGEMDLLAKSIVQGLVKRRVNIIAVSTLDTGPQIAQRILDDAARLVDNYTYGTNYLNVFIPGSEAGLAQLAATGLPATTDFVAKKPLAQSSLATSVKNLRGVWVIDLAGSEEPLRMWVEQVQPRAGVRIAAAVSAGVEPKARAYRGAGQLAAMMSGLMGAAQYEVLSNQPGLAVISVNAQTAAQLALVFVILIGNLVFWISRARGKAA
ncbi:MAG: zinc-ribbon domain-containing protein [Chloroflexota bacterium]|nr:zinc-ribbon domain-containing protein [Chloroflexota bacterium]